MGCQKAAQQSANANRNAGKGIKVRNNPGSFLRYYRIVDKIRRAEIKPCPKYTCQAFEFTSRKYTFLEISHMVKAGRI